jgi:hypothetical protein
MYQIVLRSVAGEPVVVRIGDELVVPGIPSHKMRYVGPLGPFGEDVVDPVKGQSVRLIHFSSIPNKEQLFVGERGPENVDEQVQVQRRALEVVSKGVLNQAFGPNCEHISSYIGKGMPESPQLAVGLLAFGALLLCFIANQ